MDDGRARGVCGEGRGGTDSTMRHIREEGDMMGEKDDDVSPRWNPLLESASSGDEKKRREQARREADHHVKSEHTGIFSPLRRRDADVDERWQRWRKATTPVPKQLGRCVKCMEKSQRWFQIRPSRCWNWDNVSFTTGYNGAFQRGKVSLITFYTDLLWNWGCIHRLNMTKGVAFTLKSIYLFTLFSSSVAVGAAVCPSNTGNTLDWSPVYRRANAHITPRTEHNLNIAIKIWRWKHLHLEKPLKCFHVQREKSSWGHTKRVDLQRRRTICDVRLFPPAAFVFYSVTGEEPSVMKYSTTTWVKM